MAPSKKKKRAVRKCLACSQPGHRLDGCRSAAAQEILRLRQLVKSKPKPEVRPSNRMDRQHRKRKQDKSSAHFDYTKKSARCSPAQRRTLDERSWSTHLQGIKHGMSTPQAAHRLLMKAGFLHKPRQCLACGRCSLGAATASRERLVVQCKNKTCRTKNSVVSHGPFRGSRASPQNLLAAVNNYVSQPYTRAPSVASMTKATGVLKTQAAHITETLLQVESAEGQRRSKSLEFVGDCEADATSLRTFFVSAKNEAFKKEVAAAKAGQKQNVEVGKRPIPT